MASEAGMIGLVIGLTLVALIAIVTKNKIFGRIGGSILCLEVFFVLWLLLEGLVGFGPVGQIFGITMPWLVLTLCGGLFLLGLLLIWKPFPSMPRRNIAIALAAVIVFVTGSVIGIPAYQNSFLKVPEGDDEISLWRYTPFDEGSLLAALDESSVLTLSESLPRLDGATALYPLYAAFVQATYSADVNYSGYTLDVSPIICSRTQDAFKNLVNGKADIVFLMDVSEEQRQAAEDMGLALTLTPIGREAFVFLVNSRNNIDGLTQDEVRAVYSGAITDWSDIGRGNVKGKIEAFQRPEGSGSQTALRKIMGDTAMIEPKKEQIHDLMRGMYTAVADYRNYENAIGYSFRYYIESMLNDAEMQKVKLLAIDGVAPTVQTIADGTYPFADHFYAVRVANREFGNDTERARAENAQKLIDWILSEQGQSLVEKTGYVKLQGQ
jgi:phosphate transport system substrate-binding protein